MVLAGHPRLKHELRRPSREETGARTTVFELEGIQGQQRRYITWLLEQCAPTVDPMEIVTPEALDLLAERLLTPLQIQHYLTRILEQAYRMGEKPVTPAIVDTTLAPDMHGAGADLDALWLQCRTRWRSYSISGQPKCAPFSTGNYRRAGRRRSTPTCWPPEFRSAITYHQPPASWRRDDSPLSSRCQVIPAAPDVIKLFSANPSRFSGSVSRKALRFSQNPS